jgi:hypothetical protein
MRCQCSGRRNAVVRFATLFRNFRSQVTRTERNAEHPGKLLRIGEMFWRTGVLLFKLWFGCRLRVRRTLVTYMHSIFRNHTLLKHSTAHPRMHTSPIPDMFVLYITIPTISLLPRSHFVQAQRQIQSPFSASCPFDRHIAHQTS